MFETALLSNKKDSKRGWGTLAGFTGQAVLVTLAVIAPMIWPAALPHAVWVIGLEPPGPPPAPPPPPPPGPVFKPRPTHIFRPPTDGVVAPTYIPPVAVILTDEPRETSRAGTVGGVEGGDPNGISTGLIGSIMNATHTAAPVPHVAPPAPAPAPKPAEAAATRPLRVSSSVELAHPISRVDPVYPQLARQMHIQGVVELQGVLGTDGRIHELKVLRGHPLLIKAAVDAVMQWVYSPTILNGQPVEVQAPITVTFTLRQN